MGGSFSISNLKTMAITFTLNLTAAQSTIMNAINSYLITNFLDSASVKPLSKFGIINEIVFLSRKDKRKEYDKPQI